MFPQLFIFFPSCSYIGNSVPINPSWLGVNASKLQFLNNFFKKTIQYNSIQIIIIYPNDLRNAMSRTILRITASD